MIHVGRRAIDRAGIAELHGLTWRQARRARPWAQPGHPEPITQGRPTNGRPQLWDQEQAEAFARGEALPELPVDRVDARDLLDRFEAAERAAVDAVAWERDSYRDRVPPADKELYGMPFWYRETVDDYQTGRAVPKPRPGRPSGAAEPLRRGEVRDRVHELLREAIDRGVPISTAEIARRLGIHYATAHRHVSAIRRDLAP